MSGLRRADLHRPRLPLDATPRVLCPLLPARLPQATAQRRRILGRMERATSTHILRSVRTFVTGQSALRWEILLEPLPTMGLPATTSVAVTAVTPGDTISHRGATRESKWIQSLYRE